MHDKTSGSIIVKCLILRTVSLGPSSVLAGTTNKVDLDVATVYVKNNLHLIHKLAELGRRSPRSTCSIMDHSSRRGGALDVSTWFQSVN